MDKRELVGIIAEEDMITGFEFTGLVRNVEKPNFIPVTPETPEEELEILFSEMVTREDIAIIFICDFAAEKIHNTIKKYNDVLPSILIIPSKQIKANKDI
ncbi:Vacuolar ATP synthase subunit F [Spraguea lophii 42_110]|uniref:Vacuolar ATP synthase subunit F n=1 Tax=Spraguea lophii (strain 42_110) TaxID=1358809 RepID=S7WAG5_SPRLO|nr:Vacuolar ATP synthase subunit F [Spraguea lophii 42_110]